jgi:hypothetical protein
VLNRAVLSGVETMAGIEENWNKTLADAKKILGNNAKIPVDKMSVVLKDLADANKASDEFDALLAPIQKKLAEWRAAVAKTKTSMVAADGQISNDHYALDPKKPDDKKKIDQAKALFTKFFKSTEESLDAGLKRVRTSI